MTLIDAVRKFMVEEHISDNRHISSVDDIKFAVTKAYHDLMLRTIPGHNYTVQNECIPWLTCEIEKFIKKEIKTEKEYNAEHKKLCNGFLAMLNSQLKDAGASKQLFGKAQKAVNMSLKYLYCFCDHQDYMNLFTFAHMPLDTYTLNWYYSNSSKDWKEKHKWSNLSADEYYNKIVGEIPDIIEKTPEYEGIALPSSPLEADFIIWAGEKRKAALKELKNILKKSGKNSDLIQSITPEDKKEMREYFEQIMQDRAE